MQNLKFFSLLRTLTSEEVSAFHKYLKHMHGGDEIAIKVFEYSKKVYPNLLDTKKLDLAYAYRKIFKSEIDDEQKANRKNMLNALSELHLWLKDFLLLEKVRSDSWESQVLWLGILQQRGLWDQFARHTTRFYQEAIVKPKKSAHDYLENLAAGYLQYQNLRQNKAPLDMYALAHCIHMLDTGMELLRLKKACEVTDRKKVRPSEISFPISIPPPTPVMPPLEIPVLLQLYREIFQLIDTEHELHYNRIETMLIRHSNELDLNELKDILSYLHNYIAIQSRKHIEKESVLIQKTHQLNQLSLQYGVFAKGGKMSAIQFTNIVNVACAEQDLDWVDAFMTEQIYLLPEGIRDDTILLSKSIVLFEQKKYDEVLKRLEPVVFKNIHYNLRARSLVLRSYFELKEDIDVILDYCKLFEAVLRRGLKSKISAVESTRRFVQLYKLLVLEEVDKQSLLEQINNTKNLYFRNWLHKHALNYRGKYAAHKQGK